MRQLKPTDAAMLLVSQPHTPNHVLPIMTYEPERPGSKRPSYDDVLVHLEARLPGARTLREKLVSVPFGLDLPYWVADDDFDLEYHVRHLALARPGDWA